LLEALGFVKSHPTVDEGSEHAIRGFSGPMDGQARAMAGDTVLGLIIRPDFFRAVAGFDQAATSSRDGYLQLLSSIPRRQE